MKDRRTKIELLEQTIADLLTMVWYGQELGDTERTCSAVFKAVGDAIDGSDCVSGSGPVRLVLNKWNTLDGIEAIDRRIVETTERWKQGELFDKT